MYKLAFKLYLYFFFSVLLAVFISTKTIAQIGDASAMPGAPSKEGPYGMNSSDDGIDSITFASRRYRRGNEGGIGGSYLGTESVTTESQPLSKYISPSTTPTSSPALSLSNAQNKPRSFSETMMYSPALLSTPFSQPMPSTLAGQTSAPMEFSKIDSSSFNSFLRQQKPQNFSEPAINSFSPTELWSK